MVDVHSQLLGETVGPLGVAGRAVPRIRSAGGCSGAPRCRRPRAVVSPEAGGSKLTHHPHRSAWHRTQSLTYADGRPIFPTSYRGRPRPTLGARLVIEPDFLWSYGSTRVPMHLWTALRRLSAWVEPMLLGEWLRLSLAYAAAQGRTL